MRFTTFTLALGLAATALSSAIPQPAPEALAEAQPVSEALSDIAMDNTLDKRACVYNGCTCSSNVGTNWAVGVYCGKCFQVYTFGTGGKKTDAYQCVELFGIKWSPREFNSGGLP
ncbi:hypothetical protein EYR41_005743 [Orbilia oligospora]|uniref:Uncharacterized protein n=1 Tax=Orbilia oligospora TaxID=2813651 RepID=A0A8H2E1L3_ORBOL|nr:hypothetical protein EYR41_005743 [Orbilia oligospora]